jgi:hypothetical protein
MSFWTTAAPLIGMGLGAAAGSVVPGVGTAIGMGVGGALGGAVGGMEKEKAERAKEARTLNARADAMGASWARRDGVGVLPDAKYATGNDYGLQGAVGAGMQGFSLGNSIQNAPSSTPSYLDKNFSLSSGAQPAPAYNLGADYGPGFNNYAPSGPSYNLGMNKSGGPGGFDYVSAKNMSPKSTYTLFGSR